MKNAKYCLVLVFIAGLNGFLSAAIVQNFGVSGDPYMRIDLYNDDSGEAIKGGAAFDVTPTGFSWGGYCAPTGFSVEIDQNTRLNQTTDELIFKVNPTNDYAYTIFDSTGGSTADQSVDLSGAGSNIHLKMSAVWSGWFGGGDNGSGLPGVASEVRATVLRAMIRDRYGDWYVSDLFCPSILEDGSTLGKITEYTYLLDGQSWYAVDAGVSNTLNLLQGGDEAAMAYSDVAGSPDLTSVTGGGIYVWNGYATSNGQFALTEIQWNNIPEPASILLLGIGCLASIKRSKHDL